VFDTNLVVVGNVLSAPEWRRITSTGSLVANFRIASTARRFDRETGRWIDGNSFRVRVTAWRRLAEGVASSVAVGDPVVVYGRLYSRDWKDEKNNSRLSYEMEAFSIGHDLARGRAKFFRTKSAQATSEIETAEADTYVRGESSIALTGSEAPVEYGDGLPDRLAEQEPTFFDVVAGEEPEFLVASAETPEPAATVASAENPEPAEKKDDDDGDGDGDGGSGDESPSEADDLTIEVERLVSAQPGPTRRRRASKREPVAA
jgi:single-strand DNA-binding protein